MIRLFHQGDDGAHDYLLYNLKDDMGEQTNLAQACPEIVQLLDRVMEAYLQDTVAVTPLPNPKFDPAKDHPEQIGVRADRNAMHRKKES